MLAPDGALQPARAAGDRRSRWASTSAACRSASRSPPARDRDHVAIAVALELERASAAGCRRATLARDSAAADRPGYALAYSTVSSPSIPWSACPPIVQYIS